MKKVIIFSFVGGVLVGSSSMMILGYSVAKAQARGDVHPVIKTLGWLQAKRVGKNFDPDKENWRETKNG